MSNPPRGFGFSPNILGELKSKQKETGRYVKQHSSDLGSQGSGEEGVSAPPIPRRPKLPPSSSGSTRSNDSRSLSPLPQPSLEHRGRASSTASSQSTGSTSSPVPPPPPPQPPQPPPQPTKQPPQPPPQPTKQPTQPPPQPTQQPQLPPQPAKQPQLPPQPAKQPPPQPAQQPQLPPQPAKQPPPQVPSVVKVSEEEAEEENSQVSEQVPKVVKRRDLEPKKDPFEEWDTYYAEGEPYYVNRKTGETTWEKPVALRTEAESEAMTGDFVWVQHEQLAWIPARILEERPNGPLVVEECPRDAKGLEVEQRRLVKKDQVGPRILSNQSLLSLTNDLVQLDEVHEPGIIDLLRRRYAADKIYTNVGDILVAINPFKPTDLFSPSLMHHYAQSGGDVMDLTPHPYAIINAAYRTMVEDGKDQSLLISGESGAGKTVTVKVCLEFLSEIAGSDNNIEQRILAANPILEAFGNAKTVRNDNSSRFGKFMEIHFNTEMKRHIIGCHTINYLLEKSRVVDQAPGERNFHIFHYLVTQFSTELQKRYHVDVDPSTFNYLPKDNVLPDQHNDAGECSKMHKALEDMGFSEEEQDGMFRIVASILHLGNLDFEDFESTGSKITSACQVHLEKFCTLTGTSKEEIAKALTMHISQQRDGLLTRAFNTKMASDARNALARHLYNRLFEWIVARINKALMLDEHVAARTRSNRNLTAKASGTSSFIGMLDIFGFEIFENNSFEQLSINFANEKLQQMFNRHTFTLEEQTYINEGVPFDKIEFHDSQALLNFLGLHASGASPIRDGVFQLLDEQTAINGTDEKFLQAVVSRHGDKRNLFSDRCKSRSCFIVMHYAGAVEYETAGFIYKNADKLYENIEEAMANTSNKTVADIFTAGSTLKEAAAPKLRRAAKTQASLFMKQLSQLEDRTNATFPHYIRCVKPNSLKRPNLFVAPMCLEQLRFAGVFEAVQIRKLGYPFRKSHAAFFATYRCIAPDSVPLSRWQDARRHDSFGQVAKDLLAAIAAGPVPEAKDCRFGKTMILYRADQHRNLEIRRLGVLNKAAATIQKIIRGKYVRTHVPELRAVRKTLAAAIRERKLDTIDKALAESNALFFKIKEAYDAEAVKAAMKMELSLEPKIARLHSATQNAAACFDEAIFSELDGMCTDMRKYMARDKLAFASNSAALELVKRHGDFVEQRKAKVAVSHVVGQVPHKATLESIKSLEEALASVNVQSPAPELTQTLQAAQDALSSLKTEVELSSKCQTILGECAIIKRQNEDKIDISNLKAHLPRLLEARSTLVAHAVTSPDGVDAAKRVELVCQLMEAVVTAMENAQHADDPEWIVVERLVGEAQGLCISENQLFRVPGEQLSLINGELALRAEVDKVVSKLSESIDAVNDETLAACLEQAHALHLLQHQDETIRTLVVRGDDLLDKIRTARRKLTDAVQAVNELLLYEALTAQSECGWGDVEGMVGFETVENARELYMFVQNLTREARKAVEALELEPTCAIVQGCDEIGLDIPELAPLREFLALPKDRQLLQQRDAAVSLENYPRAVSLSVAHKDLLFASQESRENFLLENFPNLKSPEEFAKRFGLTFSRYKHNMLHFYNPTFGGKIHTSLTMIEPHTMGPDGKPLHKTATLLFKNVFGIMGDKQYENVDSLVVDLVQAGLKSQELADEIFCQVMKQLTQNPKEESRLRGWNLMAMLLSSFPPSSQLENYLEFFLRRSAEAETFVRPCVKILHCTLLFGPLLNPPSIPQIAGFRTPGNTEVWFDGGRTQITIGKEILHRPATPDQVVVDWRQPQDEAQQAFQQGFDYDRKQNEVPVMERPAPASVGQAPPPPPKKTPPSQAPPPPPKKMSNSSALPQPSVPAGSPVPPPPPPKRRPSQQEEGGDEDDEDDII